MDTLEEPLDFVSVLPSALGGYDTCLLDCLTLWVSNLMLNLDGQPDVQRKILAAAHRLIEKYEQSPATWIVVSN